MGPKKYSCHSYNKKSKIYKIYCRVLKTATCQIHQIPTISDKDVEIQLLINQNLQIDIIIRLLHLTFI